MRRKAEKEFKNTRNPILPLDIHIPDSEGHVMPDGKLYLYGSYDDRETEYCSEKYYVVSTPDIARRGQNAPPMKETLRGWAALKRDAVYLKPLRRRHNFW